MNTDGNLDALRKYESKVDKQEQEVEVARNDLFQAIEPYIYGLNNSMRIHAMFSVMDKQEILEYVKETLDNLLEVK